MRRTVGRSHSQRPFRAVFAIQVMKETFLHLSKVQVFGKREMPRAPAKLRTLVTAGELQIGLDDKTSPISFGTKLRTVPCVWRLPLQAKGRHRQHFTNCRVASNSRDGYSRGPHAATLVERFEPDGTTIKWNVEILGKDDPWPANTDCAWLGRPSRTRGSGRPEVTAVPTKLRGTERPSDSCPFSNRTWIYGGPDPTVSSGGIFAAALCHY